MKSPLTFLVLAAVLAVGCSAGSVRLEDTDVAPPPVHDPRNATVLFLPGLLAPELGAGPAGETPTNLWPGEAEGLEWSLNFKALGMVSTRDASWTTSSEDYPRGAGSVPLGNGTVAAHEPVPLRPM